MLAWLRGPHDRLPNARQALPPDSEAPGLLAAGGDLSVERLHEAYSQGVFPWFGAGQPIMWWAPDPRMVLYTDEFKLSRSLRKTLARFVRTPGCEVRIDSAFRQVVSACARTPREGQDGTWIVPAMQEAYCQWHALGQVHSVETWVDGQLVGGLYGVSLGRMFFGESMFSHATDASKIAMAALVAFCREHGMPVIDCQQHTEHLASLGAREVSRSEFEAAFIPRSREPAVSDWTYDPSLWAHVLPRTQPMAGNAG